MYRDDRELEERVELLEARLAQVQDELRAARADAPKTRKRELKAERKELRSERRALRRARKPDHEKPVGDDDKRRPFWVRAFWFVVHILGAAAGGASADMDDIPSTRATVLVILSLLALAGIITLAIMF